MAVWLAIAAAAIIFGLLHLSSTAILFPITPFIIVRALILNGVAGAIFGWLFWEKGLRISNGITLHSGHNDTWNPSTADLDTN